MEAALAELRKQYEELRKQNETLRVENALLRQKVQSLIQRMFGKKSEKLDPLQLLLELGEALAAVPFSAPEDDDPPPPRRKSKRRSAKELLPDDLPEERTVIDPPEVEAEPEAYDCIGQEETVELDVEPMRFVKRVTVRRKFVRKDRSTAPVIAPAPKQLIQGSIASPSLLTYIAISKFIDHLPLYRQEKIFARHGIILSRKRMCAWLWQMGHWLRIIYDEMRKEAFAGGYLQVDETPVRYLDPGHGQTRKGYLWAYHAPGQAIIFDWHTGRDASCLESMLADFDGRVQCDGYQVYQTYNQSRCARRELVLCACWAHVRRKFFEAKDDSPLAAEILSRIQQLYRIERELHEAAVEPDERQRVRQARSRTIIETIGQTIDEHIRLHLPKGPTGKALRYTHNLWPMLVRFLDDGLIEIDNNGVENAIRPIALGRKNWMFLGSGEAGEPAAIIYSVVETCRKLSIDPRTYLLDVLTRLPHLKAHEARELTPARWLAARKPQRAQAA